MHAPAPAPAPPSGYIVDLPGDFDDQVKPTALPWQKCTASSMTAIWTLPNATRGWTSSRRTRRTARCQDPGKRTLHDLRLRTKRQPASWWARFQDKLLLSSQFADQPRSCEVEDEDHADELHAKGFEPQDEFPRTRPAPLQRVHLQAATVGWAGAPGARHAPRATHRPGTCERLAGRPSAAHAVRAVPTSCRRVCGMSQ